MNKRILMCLALAIIPTALLLFGLSGRGDTVTTHRLAGEVVEIGANERGGRQVTIFSSGSPTIGAYLRSEGGCTRPFEGRTRFRLGDPGYDAVCDRIKTALATVEQK